MLLKNQTIAAVCCGLILGFAPGCRCFSEPVPVTAQPDHPADGGMREHCQAVGDVSYRLQAGADPDGFREKAGAGAPFSVEVGAAVAFAGGYAVSSVSGQVAHVTLVNAGLDSGRVVDLGRAAPSSTPPALAVAGNELLVVFGGGSRGALTLARVTAGGELQAGKEIAEDEDESKVFALAGSGATAVLAWDAWDAATRHSQIRLAALAVDGQGEVGPSQVVSPPGTDVESPHLVARPGGYWLAWIAVGTPLHAAAVPSPEGAGGAPAPTSPVDTEAPEPQSEVGAAPLELESSAPPRWIELLRLNAQGAAEGVPVKVSTPQPALSGVDLLAGADGSVQIAWREQATTVSAEGGRVYLGRLDAQGSVQTSPVEDSALGAGLPFFIADLASPTKATPAWLVLPDGEEDSRLGPLGAPPLRAETLSLEPRLRSATILLRQGRRLLVARPRGRDVELSLLECQF